MEWSDFIEGERKKDYFKNLSKSLVQEEKKYTIFPKKENIFNAFNYCAFNDVKVVILGQDPYINPGQAHGFSFSVPDSFPLPPSLLNIFKELKNDLDIPISKNGNLIPWANQGILLLNSFLTVRWGESGSHSKLGWQTFTDGVIKKINNEKENITFILWGSFARSKKSLITNNTHFILESVHPSPLSAFSGFFGSKPFSKTNNFLQSKNLTAINWDLSNENK